MFCTAAPRAASDDQSLLSPVSSVCPHLNVYELLDLDQGHCVIRGSYSVALSLLYAPLSHIPPVLWQTWVSCLAVSPPSHDVPSSDCVVGLCWDHISPLAVRHSFL